MPRSRLVSIKFSVALASLSLAGVLGGCGPNTYKTGTHTSGSTSSTTDSGGEAAATAAGPSNPGGGYPPLHLTIQGTGYDSLTATVSTGTKLKVSFIPGKQNKTYNGKFYPYSVLGVYLGVDGYSQPTELLANGYDGQQPARATPIDLSSQLPNGCSGQPSSCRQQVHITVTMPNNDDGCINAVPGYGCPYSHVPDGHPWNGTLLVETDDTSPL